MAYQILHLPTATYIYYYLNTDRYFTGDHVEWLIRRKEFEKYHTKSTFQLVVRDTAKEANSVLQSVSFLNRLPIYGVEDNTTFCESIMEHFAIVEVNNAKV